jgi:hypothetical protein
MRVMRVTVRQIFLALLLVAAVMAVSSIQEAEARLLGTRGFGFGANSILVEIDPATGATISTIGPVGYTVNGLEYDATTGKLYGSTSAHGLMYNGLIEIDPNTGAGTPIGVSGWGLVNPTGCPTAVTNITVDSAGQMFGWWDPCEDDLVSIDKSTGIATRVGESGVGTGTNGLSFNSSDILYMVNPWEFYTINTVTGAATYAGNIGIEAHHGDFDPASDLYYGLTWPYGVPKWLVVADLSTGTVISMIELEDSDIHTLTFVSMKTVSIDIKPGSFPNSINPKNKGVIPVAVLTTEDFDAATVDPDSVKFGPAGAKKVHEKAHLEDVDGDGDVDMVLHFETQETGIQADDTEACLTGKTTDGMAIRGCDSVRTVGGPKAAPSLSPAGRVTSTWGGIKAKY